LIYIDWRSASKIMKFEADDRYMVGSCLLCQSKEHALRGCGRVNYKHGQCCMTCGLPQMAFGERIHGNVETGECEEGLKDMVKGICWGIFRDSELKGRYLLGIFNGDEGEFKRWIVEMDESMEITNGVRLMLRVWRDIEI